MNLHLLLVNADLKRTISIVHTRHNFTMKTVAFQKCFITDVNCLEKAVIRNLFMLDLFTVLNNHDKAKFNNGVFEDIKIIETEGQKQFLHFWEKRLVSAELSINVTISLN